MPNFSVIALVLAGLDLSAALPEPAMAGMAVPFGLESRSVPFVSEWLPHVLLWSSVRAGDPETAWVRQHLQPWSKKRFAVGYKGAIAEGTT